MGEKSGEVHCISQDIPPRADNMWYTGCVEYSMAKVRIRVHKRGDKLGQCSHRVQLYYYSDSYVQYRDSSPVPWTDRYLMILDFNPFTLKHAHDGAGGLSIDTHVVHAHEDPARLVMQDLFKSEDIGEAIPQVPYRVTMSRVPLEGSRVVPWEGGLVHWVSYKCALNSHVYSCSVFSQRRDKHSFEVWRF
jgi:hypothetical protein